jgi:hypothetical protein
MYSAFIHDFSRLIIDSRILYVFTSFVAYNRELLLDQCANILEADYIRSNWAATERLNAWKVMNFDAVLRPARAAS